MSNLGNNIGLNTNDLSQEMYTPFSACELFDKILCATGGREVKKHYTLYDPYYGRGDIMTNMQTLGYTVESKEFDPKNAKNHIAVTNPPFRTKDRTKALNMLFDNEDRYGTPFMTILRLEHLGGVQAYDFFASKNISVWIPKRRIRFITPKNRSGENKHSNPSFHSIILCYGAHLFTLGGLRYIDNK